MAKKRKTLVDNLQEIIDSGDLDAFQAVFDKCEINATNRGATTCNALSYRNLTPAHIQFLIDNGLDVNADCGWGYSTVALQAGNKDNLKCLLDHGADINCIIKEYNGSAVSRACSCLDVEAVKNLLEQNASIDVKCDLDQKSLLEAVLAHCDNAYIVNALEISKMLIDAGAFASDRTKEYVHRIGERFEVFRADFNKERVEQYSDALDELYKIFDVEPVPRREIHDGTSVISIKATTWQKQHEELWNMLVPGKGKAQTMQGEMIRIVGKVLYEILDNGGINWDDDYRQMLRTLHTFLQMGSGIESGLVEEACNLTKKISPHSSKKELYRLNELVVQWVIANPEPVKLGDVDYDR